MPRTRKKPPYSKASLKKAIDESVTFAEALRLLGLPISGSNHRNIKQICTEWNIDTSHLSEHLGRTLATHRRATPLEEMMTKNSSFSRGNLKRRLLAEGVKERKCELCGQGEEWRGKKMSLILDHINGIRNDHRLENLRIVCPNCNATLDTHCGKNVKKSSKCLICKEEIPKESSKAYCSKQCRSKGLSAKSKGVARPNSRKVKRPTWTTLKNDLANMSYCAIGRKYGVSDNAVRKWVRFYKNQELANKK